MESYTRKPEKMSDVWFINKQFDEINENNAYLKEFYDNQKVKKVVYTYAIDYRTWEKIPQEWRNKSSFKDIPFLKSDLQEKLGNEGIALANLLNFEVLYGVTSIGDECFLGCVKLAGIKIPSSVKSIGNDCFRNCVNLTTITLPEGLTSIGEKCFSLCTELTTITLPDGLTSIGKWCFFGCNKLNSITLPDDLTSIGDDCFSFCEELTTITLPDDLTSIGDECFRDCNNLNSITLPKRFRYHLQDLGIDPKRTKVTYIEDAQVTATGNESENAAPNDNAEDNPTDENA